MGTASEHTVELQGIVDLLGRHDPAFLDQKRAEYPRYADALSPGRKLGADGSPDQEFTLIMDLVERALPPARLDGEKCLDRLRVQSWRITRMRLTSNVIAALASGGLLGLLLASHNNALKIVAATLGFLGSAFALIAEAREGHLGGGQALSSLRNTLIEGLVELAAIEGDVRLLTVRRTASDALALAQRLNLAISRIRQVELSLR